MSIIWIAVVLLIALLYVKYRWEIVRKLSSQQQQKSLVTSSNPSETETSSQQSSVYSASGQSLSVFGNFKSASPLSLRGLERIKQYLKPQFQASPTQLSEVNQPLCLKIPNSVGRELVRHILSSSPSVSMFRGIA